MISRTSPPHSNNIKYYLKKKELLKNTLKFVKLFFLSSNIFKHDQKRSLVNQIYVL